MIAYDSFIAMLQCPACSGTFAWQPVTAPAGHGAYGILTCQCRRYPVIDGIPVLMPGRVGVIAHWNDRNIHLGPTAQELVTLLEQGRPVDALVECLLFPRTFPGQGRLRRAGLWSDDLGRRAGLSLTRKALRALLARPADDLTAEDLFRFFYSRRSGQNTFLVEYFLHRFVMPRFLSAMALVQRIAPDERPVLDVACGFGHFEHYLTRRKRRTPAVGVDFNFYQVWGAKRTVAPDAQFVCCDASVPLPFRSDTFSAAICSDAFMLMPDKTLLAREVDRVAPGAPAVYARLGNVGVGPPNPPGGGELTPAQYHALFGETRSRGFSDDALWKDYLERRDPRADPRVDLARMRWEKYVTFVVHPDRLSADGEADGDWCHGVGRLAVNPTLTLAPARDGAIASEFMFGSVWGAYEDADMMCYTERWGKIDAAQLDTALRDLDSDAAKDLLRRFVLIGVPDRYLRRAGTRPP